MQDVDLLSDEEMFEVLFKRSSTFRQKMEEFKAALATINELTDVIYNLVGVVSCYGNNRGYRCKSGPTSTAIQAKCAACIAVDRAINLINRIDKQKTGGESHTPPA